MDRDDTYSDQFESDTRRVFDAHHREQAGDERTYERLVSLVDEAYFKLEPGWLTGKKVLDAGCGSNANASRAFLEAGAAHVHSVDLGEAWMDVARDKLVEFGSRSSLGSESVLNLSFPNSTFDFVHCAGVLHHTSDPKAGHAELVRVTKPTGYTYVSIMANANGLLYQFFNHARARYKADPSFRMTIDNLTIGQIVDSLDWLVGEKRLHEPSSPEEESFLGSLFDSDLVLTIKDRIQAPTYHDFDFTEEQIRGWYHETGSVNVERITRYTYGFQNLRRFLAPMYLHYDHPMARFWFGEGYVQMIGQKA